LAIPELKLKEHPMTSVQFERYVNHLNTFVDHFPVSADKMRDHLDAEAYDLLARDLVYLSDTLRGLYAVDIAQECRKQADAIARPGKVDTDALESFLENILLSVASLSIEIQMASYRGVPGKTPAPQKPSQPRPTPPVTPVTRAGKYPLIMAVDNAVMFLNTLKKLLQDAPYELYCTASCAEALEYLQRNRPDMFLLDIEMPEMDGYTLARRIISSGQRAPIIFITANSAREYVDKAIDVGAAGLLMKPLRVNQLLTKIKEFI